MIKKPIKRIGEQRTQTGNPPLERLISYFCSMCDKHLFAFMETVASRYTNAAVEFCLIS